MAHYIDTDRLKAEIERLNSLVPYESKDRHDEGLHDAYKAVKNVITSLQQEQFDIIDSICTKAGIPAPYKDGNQWSILKGDNIQEGVVGFGDTKSEALVNFIKDIPIQQKQPEVDFEKEIDACWKNWLSPSNKKEVEGVLPRTEFAMYARHFYELGLNARKEDQK